MLAPDVERELVLRSRKGEPEAFEQLMAAYQQMIHALAFRMTGSLADAEDLTQETFIQAFRQLDGFRSEAAFGSWLYRIAVNKTLNHRQRGVNRERLQAQWTVEQSHQATAPADGRLFARVQEALLKLDARQRAAVVLTTYDGMNHAEAARVLGCSETTVSWRVFTARRKLKRWLQKNEGAADE